MGVPQLADGIDVVVVAVGIFAVGGSGGGHLRRRQGSRGHPLSARPWMGREDWKRSWKPWLRGTAFGFPFGAIPAGGAEMPTFLSYMTEKKLSKHPEEFGKGAIEGVAGPEAAQRFCRGHAVVGGRAGAADERDGRHHAGRAPGLWHGAGAAAPREAADLVWALVASLFIGNTMLLVLNLPLAPAWAKLLQIPRPYLYAGILFFASMGAYAVNSQPFDLFLLLALGLLGFAMRRFGLPVLPLIVGVILGPLAEKQARRSLQLSGGDPSGLIGGPVAWVCYAIIAVVLLWPLVAKVIRSRRGEDHDVENKSEVSV